MGPYFPIPKELEIGMFSSWGTETTSLYKRATGHAKLDWLTLPMCNMKWSL